MARARYHRVKAPEIRRMRDMATEGHSSAAIARQIGCSPSTVRGYALDVPKPGPIAQQRRARFALRKRAEHSQRVIELALSVFPEARL